MNKEQNGRESLRRLKPTVGCNTSKRSRRTDGNILSALFLVVVLVWHVIKSLLLE
jgi:hypothetical protein